MSDNDVRQVTGIILAGGQGKRLGQDKVHLRLGDASLSERVVSRLRPLCEDIIVVVALKSDPGIPGARPVQDIYPGCGALSGIHAGLKAASSEHSLVVACDMPFLNRDLLRYMIGQAEGHDVVIPRIQTLTEPLHAVYSQNCVEPIEELLAQGGGRIISFFPQVRVRYIDQKEVDQFDPQHRSLFNVNTSDDWEYAWRCVFEGTA